MFDDGHLEFGNCFAFVSVESGNFEFKLDSYEEHIASDEHSPSIGNTSRELWNKRIDYNGQALSLSKHCGGQLPLQ